MKSYDRLKEMLQNLRDSDPKLQRKPWCSDTDPLVALLDVAIDAITDLESKVEDMEKRLDGAGIKHNEPW